MPARKISKLLVANRGEIACRVFRTAERMGIRTCAVFTEHDEGAPHTEREAMQIGDYLDIEQVLAAALKLQADAIHPGYGFLAENPAFAEACEGEGIVFLGPTASTMRAIGDKSEARKTVIALGVPTSEGLGPFTSVEEIEAAARSLGPPLMLKAAAGGGGKGMKRIEHLEGIRDLIESAQRETNAAFGDSRMIVERYIHPARHVEVQIMGDGARCIALGERECSLQRRHQKIIEESPSPAVSKELRQRLMAAAIKIGEHTGYRSAGTVEFLLDSEGGFYFLEVNARLQVEHPVTELITGLDLVQMQIEVAGGVSLPKQEDIRFRGHAIEARLNAEDPYAEFLPSSGRVLRLQWPEGVDGIRIDTGIGATVSSRYDSLLAKLIAHAEDREAARKKLVDALKATVLLGLNTNQGFLVDLLESPEFVSGRFSTSTIDNMDIVTPPTPDAAIAAACALLRGPTHGGSFPWNSVGSWELA